MRISSSPASGGFAPGQVLLDRYRIVSLLGRGGMGEVYRADDLKLGMAVALKFLPLSAARDPSQIERFHAEVRNARQVAHPHVCRVYDIGEVGGRHFLSMEYVDGEDLATLLRRIGRLPPAKAVEIARQIASGLAAAHEKGVLHRDLKPANVMIDGHGRARITDFGLAVAAQEAEAELAGTPAYMAPEQLAGQAATPQGDIYALGLVLYELFTGKRPHEAETLAGWKRARSETPPTSPSLHASDMDPVVERIILRCLEPDPSFRPRSAAQVLLGLPGGDPLAAALAAGETPSPQMVAAAGGEGALSPARAWTALAGFLALLVALLVISPASTDLGLAPMEKSPDVLRDRAREILRAFGYTKRPADEATWLRRDYLPIRWLADHERSTEWRRRLRELGAPVVLVYRRSESSMTPEGAAGYVSGTDPPPDPEDVVVVVDGSGRLRRFTATPALWSERSPDTTAFPVERIFREAGLDPGRFRRVDPERVPTVPFGERREWIGTRSEAEDIELRLSAATLSGRLVSMTVAGPWDARDAPDPERASLARRIGGPVLAFTIVALWVAGVIFARRNIRLGRGDRRGAFRAAVAGFCLSLLTWIPGVHLSANLSGLVQGPGFAAIGRALLHGCGLWLIYMSLEPYLRRKMPHLLVGWARMLEGRFRDPRVGNEVLRGLIVGAFFAVLFHVVNGLPTWFPFPSQTTIPSFSQPGSDRMLPWAIPFAAAHEAIQRTLFQLMVFFLLRLFTSRSWIAVGILTAFFTLLGLGGENVWLETPQVVVVAFVVALTLVRSGPLALGVAWFTTIIFTTTPLRASPSLWYAPHAAVALALMLGLAFWAFRTALGGRSAFGATTLEG